MLPYCSKKVVGERIHWKGGLPVYLRRETFTVGTDDFISTEALGLKEVGKCGFVLVAGGLGERLGYGDIKVSVL